MDCFGIRTSRALFATASFATASFAAASLAFVSGSEAQRCVDPGDSTDIPADHRYCGAPLIDLGLGPSGFGDPAVPATDGCLHLNDDGSSAPINILPYFPGGLNFFTARHESLFVNTNGNITFSGALADFTTDPFPVADQAMIAPFWSDVDIRTSNGACGVTPAGACIPNATQQVWWHFEPGRAYITWNEVGFFNCHADRRNSYQLVLNGAEGCGGVLGGDFDVEFRYNRCEWDTGDIDGASGFSDSPTTGAAQVGFDAGDTINFVEVMNSRSTRVITRTLCEDSNVGMPGIWRFQIRGGTIICPDAGEVCTVNDAAGAPLLGACAAGRTNCVGGGVECVQQIEPRAEICDNIDNDCDGMVDDGDDASLCLADGQSCIAGVCVDNCFEGSCAEGLVCNAEDLCVEPTCDGVSCDENQRCVGGACVPACEGIVCPGITSCVAGRCVAVCEGLTCDDCTVCEGGECVPRCTSTSCGPGEECSDVGSCVSAGCTGVTCPSGTVCRSGGCVDACLDAICPPGDVCMAGLCARRERSDAGPRLDAGTPDGGNVDGGMGSMDGSIGDAAVDGGREPPPAPRGCACSVPVRGGGSAATGLVGLLGLLGVVLARRRR